MTDAQEKTRQQVRLEPWSEGDHWLLRRTNTPEMTEHLGGPETDEQIAARHQRYLRLGGSAGRMFRIVLVPGQEVVGSIGYWEHDWQGGTVYETGWGVLPEFQGRGIAVAAAAALVVRAAADGVHRYVHAFPSVHHAASNAVCRKAGFTLAGPCDFEYPKGNPIRSNDWWVDLAPRAGS